MEALQLYYSATVGGRLTALTHEGLSEHVVGHAPALGDALRLVEHPVDSQVDAALAVLFLGLRERREATRYERARVALVVERLAVELVRHEREANAVGPVEVAQDLEERPAEARMAGGVGRERWGEVGSVEVARGRAERRVRGIGCRPRIAVGLANAGDRAPEHVVVLRLPDRDPGVGHRHVDQGQETGELDAARPALLGDV